MEFTTRKQQPTVKLGAKVPSWMQDVTIPSNPTPNNDGQKPLSVLKTVQDNFLNLASSKPTKLKSNKNTQNVAESKPMKPIPTDQPLHPSNSETKPDVNGRDPNFNLFNGENIGLAAGGSQPNNVKVANRKLTKKERQQLQKKQRTMAAGAKIANGDPAQENGDPNQSAIDDDKAEDQMGVTETYADYKPAKLSYGKPHPDPVVETSTLSSIEPNDITYQLSIPKRIIEKGYLSALQLESIVYASQAHQKMLKNDTRAGFLIGDGAGVGKGRTVAGIIFENFQKGRKKAIWISVSNDLKFDAERDLEDIGAIGIDVWPLNKLKYDKIDSAKNDYIREGVIFSTYQSLISATKARGVSAKYNSRLKQLVDWCGRDFDGVIIFDECHKAKNLFTGKVVLDLQVELPLARVVYASATGASEPRNMAYMVRLGLWGPDTPFRNFPEFLQTIERRGVGLMEVVSMDMKLRGMYIARQLSFKGVTFNVEEVPLTDEFKQAYNDSVKLWIDAKDRFDEASVLIAENRVLKRSMWCQFWAAHQRFFKYLCIASKVSHAVKVAKQAVKDGNCAVIGLQSTGEARTLEAIEQADGELDDFVSTAKSVFEHLIEEQFPAPPRRFVGGAERKTEKSQPSNRNRKRDRSSSRESNDSNGRRELRELAKVRRVLYYDDSNESDSEMKMHVDNDKDGAEATKKSSGSNVRRLRSPANPWFRMMYSDDESEDDVAVISSDDDVKVKKESNESDTGSSDSGSDSNASDSLSSSDSESSFSDDDDDDSGSGSESDEYYSDDSYKSRSTRRRPYQNRSANINGKKTMQDKVYEEIKMRLGDKPDARTNTAFMAMAKRACDMRDELLDEIDRLGDRLPSNTLDQLIDELGGPDEVAEMTSRKGRVVKMENGDVQYESRCQGESSLETVNIYEKDLFMNGDKLIAIISEAASNGISLQSDRRVKNQRRRVHITLELPFKKSKITTDVAGLNF